MSCSNRIYDYFSNLYSVSDTTGESADGIASHKGLT